MPETSITLFGATGYTGRLIANALAREALPFRIAGRSADKLRELSAALPGKPAWLVADVSQPASLPPLFHESNLLINCAGPFTDLGERVIAQAAMGGVHYLDITNELGYVFRARTYAEMARRTGATLVPACGFEVAFADCAAHLAGAALLETDPEQPLDEVNVVYALGGKGASAGTRRSAVRSLATSWVAYRDGDFTGQIPGRAVRQFDLPGGAGHAFGPGHAFGRRHTLSFPSCETITVPAHLPVRRVDSWMSTTPGARFWAPIFVPLFARLSRSILRGLFLSMAARGGVSPAKALDVGLHSADGLLRTDAPFTVYTEARRGKQVCWTALQGQDPYGLTAELITYAARQLTAPGYSHSGLLAPAQALDPADFLSYAQNNWGITLTSGGNE